MFQRYIYLTQVILATNIAESSVTIPKVAFVIDSCRSLQVFWDSARRKDSTELVWVSKSQVLKESFMVNVFCLFSSSFSPKCYRLSNGEVELVVLVMAMYIGWLHNHFLAILRILSVQLY